MTGPLQGQVAFITGAARGLGRDQALRLARDGARIVATDLCAPVASAPYPAATPDDLSETERLVRADGGEIISRIVDVRSSEQLDAAVTATLDAFGRIDVVVANAGILSVGPTVELAEQQWQDVIDVNLTGVWRTCKAAVPALVDGGRGGSIIIISSTAGGRGAPNIGHYVSAKTGVVGLMRTLSLELAGARIRVNSLHPTGVDTVMIQNPAVYGLYLPGVENVTAEAYRAASTANHPMKVPWLEPTDVSNAVAFLASDESRYITGVELPIAAGRPY